MAKPRGYQKECLSALTKARAEGKHKALVVMASGLGKTLTAIFDIKNYLKHERPWARVLVLCHSADILRQTKEVFKAEFGDEYSYGLYNGKEKSHRDTDFLFANLQSVDLHKEIFGAEDFDYIVVDEAHHSAASTYGRSIKYFRPDFILGLTATPDRMDRQPLDQFFGDAPVYSKDLIEAIKEGLLSDIDYYVEIDEANRKRIRKIIGENTNITYADIDGLAANNYMANEDVVAKIHEQLAKMDEPTTVIFCQTIEHADAIHALMLDESAIVYSKYDSVTNNENIAKFRRGDIKTIITINMFNEGIDIPRTDVVVFLRITQSKTIFLQQLGRGLRRAESKEKVIVMDFVGTGARIRQIMDFEGEFSASREEHKKLGSSNSKGGPGPGHFNLHLGGHESYEDVNVELVELLSLANAHGYTDAQLISFLQKLASELGHSPSSTEVELTKNAPSRTAFFSHFGSKWNDVLAAANLEPLFYYYDENYMLEILKTKCVELGRFPKMTEIAADPRMPDPATYTNHFGSMEKAIERAKIDLSQYPRAYETYSDEQVIMDFKTECERLGRIPSHNEFILHPPAVYRQRFGGLHKIAWLAGCQEYWRDYPQRSRSFHKDEGLRLLVEKSEAINRPLSTKEIQDDWELPRPQWYQSNFGGIMTALKLGGYRGAFPRKAGVKKYSLKTAAEAIRMEYKKCGRTLQKKDFENNPHLPSPTCIAGLFGTISVALLWSGVPAGQFRHTNNHLATRLLEEMGIPNDHDAAMRLARSLPPDSTHPAKLLLK